MTERSQAPAPALTVAQACKQIGIGKTKIYELINSGELTTFKVPTLTGKRPGTRIEQEEVDAFKARHRQEVHATA